MGNAFILIVAGLLLLYVVISDRFYCIEGCISCLASGSQPSSSGAKPANLPGIQKPNSGIMTASEVFRL